MKKNSAERAALILSASIVGACIACYLILAIVLLSLGMHDVLSYISVFFCFACAISSGVFGYLAYRRHKVSRRMRQSLIGQLDDLSKGIVSYGEPLTGYDDLDHFQDEFNYSLSSLRAVEKVEDGPHYKGLGFIEEETSFPSTLLEEIRRNPSYRQALLAIKATGKGKIDDIGFQKLRAEILSEFPTRCYPLMGMMAISPTSTTAPPSSSFISGARLWSRTSPTKARTKAKARATSSAPGSAGPSSPSSRP